MNHLLLKADARAIPLRDESVHCVVTSPPYWGLRDYGLAGQLGLEKTPEEYVAHMVEVFREVRRVLRRDGTLWLNLGDCYATGAGKVGDCPGGGEQGERWKGYRGTRGESPKHANGAMGPMTQPNRMPINGLKPKDLVGIPWRVAFALQADGWWLRSDIIWAKPNPMPESVTDRPTKAHEYLFLMAKRERYFYDADAVREECIKTGTIDHLRGGMGARAGSREGLRGSPYGNVLPRRSGNKERVIAQSGERGRLNTHMGSGVPWEDTGTGRNKRSVWTIPTQPYPEVHFATFPSALVTPCIKAGTSAKGCCPRCGAPWVRVVEKSGGSTGKSWHPHKADWQAGQSQVVKVDCGAAPYRRDSKGWNPSCSCLAGEPVRCLVLDPFAGSGTTIGEAVRLGRRGVGLDLGYHALSTKRVARMAARGEQMMIGGLV